MRAMFVLRVKEKEAELKENEKEVNFPFAQFEFRCSRQIKQFLSEISFPSIVKLHAKFDKLKKDHADDKRKLEEARKKLEEEFLEFNRRKTQLAATHHTLTLGKKNKK